MAERESSILGTRMKRLRRRGRAGGIVPCIAVIVVVYNKGLLVCGALCAVHRQRHYARHREQQHYHRDYKEQS